MEKKNKIEKLQEILNKSEQEISKEKRKKQDNLILIYFLEGYFEKVITGERLANIL